MSEDIRNLDINAIVERIQDASELSYNYYKPLVDRIIAEKASEKEVEHLLDICLMYAMMIECRICSRRFADDIIVFIQR